MANQDPQPEVYTTEHSYQVSAAGSAAAAIAAGTSRTVQIYTNQANNEEVRVYGLEAQVIRTVFDDSASTTTTYYSNVYGDSTYNNQTFADFNVTIGIGPNNVPSNAFSISKIATCCNTFAFPSPILILFQQPVSIVTSNNQTINLAPALGAGQDADSDDVKVVLNFIAELAIQKVAFAEGGVGYPINPRGPIPGNRPL